MDSLYIVMPAYNEEKNVENVIKSWYPLLNDKAENSRIVIADSGSTDNTHFILLNMQEKYVKLEILTGTQKQHGPKLIALYDYAIKNGIDYIFQTDSDGQTCPSEFNVFWENRKKYDVILGHRKIRGDGNIRAFIEYVVCFLLKIYFGIRVPDANAPFRLMKTEIVKKYLYELPKEYELPNIMLTTYYAYNKEKIKFYNISFKARNGGVNSINMFRIITIGWQALKDFSYFKEKMKINI